MDRRNIELKIFGLIAGMAAGMILLAGFALTVATRHADARERDYEQTLVGNGLRQRIEEIQTGLNPYVIWDEAIHKLDNRFDQAWASQNIGASVGGALGYEAAFVLDAADKPIYAHVAGKDVSSTTFDRYAFQASSLVNDVRAIESDPKKVAALHAVHKSRVELVRGEPVLITVSLIRPDLKARTKGPRGPLLVTSTPVAKIMVKAFSERFLLRDAAIAVVAADAVDAAVAQSVLGRSADGRRIVLRWVPRRPGAELLRSATPMLAIAILAAAMGSFLLFRTTRRAAKKLLLSEAEAKHLALHDPLTGLANRTLFTDRLVHAHALLRRKPGHIGVLCIDLDRFKEVNDTYGHDAGDQLIREVARRLTAICRDTDTICRLGGDEFAIIQPDTSPAGAASLAQRVVDGLSGEVDLSIGRAVLSCSVGVSVVADADQGQAELLRQADVALYRAKEAGRGRFAFFEPEMDAALRLRKSLERDLRAALEHDELTVAYQPLTDARGEMVGVEALARWNHPERGEISPGIFIPLAESCGLIGPVGAAVFRRACYDSLRWSGLEVSVNVSAIQLTNPDFIDEIVATLAETSARAETFMLEITETALLKDGDGVHDALRRLKRLGFRLALDDFGTGYASLAYLRRHPIDKLKIDRSFVASLPGNGEAMAVASAIVSLAKSLGLKTTAEGVETQNQMDALVKLGCVEFQGYLLGRPMPAEAIASTPSMVRVR
ncbi:MULTISPECIES: EAL domain-containing protein [Caulobacter]|jgi:diguanylate cyclase (GGDEF)-like protein|uniref:Diguanylate cyclase (GGDEF) domain-containing protein n=1 Tax=Caulobacter vibrioides OR37 TaxID=1292034 RepID=R0EGP0_CAUVI|nr:MULTISPECIES: EAL domain-containing protein [Caulobacter]ENZ81179.1 diguanylate cyclase (GGDEF) domain-containing protein [Caulobacter vibrioides OR37]MBQ1562562.1 EAL domain-containing protein [Caulobacter sp.]